MALTGLGEWAGAAVDTGILADESAPLVRVPFVPTCGMVMVSSQLGQTISEPAPVTSTSSSWLQLEQLKMMSIGLGVVKLFRESKTLSASWRQK